MVSPKGGGGGSAESVDNTVKCHDYNPNAHMDDNDSSDMGPSMTRQTFHLPEDKRSQKSQSNQKQ